MGLEFERLANHTGDLGAIAGDTGFLPTSSWNGRIRGDFLNMTAEICGNRFGRGLVCPGGVNWDLDPAACRGLLDRLRAGWRDVKGAVDVMFASPSVLDRLTGTGCVSLRTAEDFGMVGVAARACGLPRDARRHAPLSRLPLEDTDIRTAQGGDVLGRATVRRLEVADSVRLVEADLQHLARLGGSNQARLIARLLQHLFDHGADRCFAIGTRHGYQAQLFRRVPKIVCAQTRICFAAVFHLHFALQAQGALCHNACRACLQRLLRKGVPICRMALCTHKHSPRPSPARILRHKGHIPLRQCAGIFHTGK